MDTSSPNTGQETRRSAEPVRVDLREVVRASPEDLERVFHQVRRVLPNLSLRFTAFFRSPVELELRAVTEEDLDSPAALPEPPAHAMAISVPHRPESGWLSVSEALLPALIDLALGGTGSHAEPLERPLTELEKSLVRAIFEMACEELASLWSGAGELSVGLHEMLPQRRILRCGPMIVIALGLSLPNLTLQGALSLALCREVLFGPRQINGEQRSVRDGATPSQILARLLNSHVVAEPHLGHLEARIGDLLALQVGDVLVFDCPASRPLYLALNGVDRFRGRLVEREGQRVFLIGETTPQVVS